MGGRGTIASVGKTVTVWHPSYGDVRGTVASMNKRTGVFKLSGGVVTTGNMKGRKVLPRTNFSIRDVRA